MKLTMKIFLLISLFSSVALADGDMGSGNRNGNNGGGGLVCAECMTVNEPSDKDTSVQEDDSIITMIEIFLKDLLG